MYCTHSGIASLDPYLGVSVLLSLASFLKVLYGTQAVQLRKISIFREPGVKYAFMYLCLALTEVTTKINFFVSAPPQIQGIPAFVYVLLHYLSYRYVLGRDTPFLIRSACLSIFLPINFIGDTYERSRQLLITLLCDSFVLIGSMSKLHEVIAIRHYDAGPDIVNVVPFVGTAVVKTIFCQFALKPLFDYQHLCYPHMRKLQDRKASFPMDILTFPVEMILKSGHFYSDVRLRKSSCYARGYIKKDWV